MIEIKASRLCQCCFIVTAGDRCPACDAVTIPHPEQLEKQEYCCDCGGEFLERELVVVTWRDDSFSQLDDGTLITICRDCETERTIELSE